MTRSRSPLSHPYTATLTICPTPKRAVNTRKHDDQNIPPSAICTCLPSAGAANSVSDVTVSGALTESEKLRKPGPTRQYRNDSVLHWFRSRVHERVGGDYQTLINDALRGHITRQDDFLPGRLPCRYVAAGDSRRSGTVHGVRQAAKALGRQDGGRRDTAGAVGGYRYEARHAMRKDK